MDNFILTLKILERKLIKAGNDLKADINNPASIQILIGDEYGFLYRKNIHYGPEPPIFTEDWLYINVDPDSEHYGKLHKMNADKTSEKVTNMQQLYES